MGGQSALKDRDLPSASGHIPLLGDAALGQKLGHWLDFLCCQDPRSLLLHIALWNPQGFGNAMSVAQDLRAARLCGLVLALEPWYIFNDNFHSLCSSLTSNYFMESRLMMWPHWVIDIFPIDLKLICFLKTSALDQKEAGQQPPGLGDVSRGSRRTGKICCRWKE